MRRLQIECRAVKRRIQEQCPSSIHFPSKVRQSLWRKYLKCLEDRGGAGGPSFGLQRKSHCHRETKEVRKVRVPRDCRQWPQQPEGEKRPAAISSGGAARRPFNPARPLPAPAKNTLCFCWLFLPPTSHYSFFSCHSHQSQVPTT
ncbi:hypothetical protein BO94DRAFT_42627 [Aspergillus sclerotioniger CBS 115572]|uniref:Uncharacterized protein n=1 Tax=Aspergillus sclerotioniger CBS 115572 TaxID=1450535 RepID=A0A317WU49_9EURO|nr:hypothetical protein BO94DRAFT_42627 [Aspergillus sclerotioniger CBS 115572]PWY89615.1 hypothetical protein BO94DRAFT_42627 [Aspergillus sclerotioniger CBS 115572]